MFPTSLLSTLLLALAVAANPIVVDRAPISLPIVRSLNVTNLRGLYEHDVARAAHFKSRGKTGAAKRQILTTADNEVVSYYATVGVGSPATQFSLMIIDTGSSNTWVGAGGSASYKVTSTSHKTGGTVSVSYGSGSFTGNEYTDQVTIGSMVIPAQSIGVATSSSGFTGTDGILGIGPVDLTQGTVSGLSSVPTVTDNLFAQGTISSEVIGISFEPTTTSSVVNGELAWGGVDTAKYTGSITYTTLTTTSPASDYWGINESITYGSSTGTTVLSTTAGIVDTGTTLLLLASNAITEYQKLTGATSDATTGLLKLTSTKFSSLQSLFFHIGGATFEFTANAQLFPRSLNTAIGGTAGTDYLIVASIGTPSGQGLDFINGYGWLERFYAVFDTSNNRFGVATTAFTTATTN
jgi:cathepsin E